MVIPFSETEINRSDIDQSLLDIDQRSRTSLFAWNGQFSPQFIEALLEKYADSSSVVYDPFAGSGTVLTESARKGLSAYGVELNPAAYYMAKCNELCVLSPEERQTVIDEVGTSLTSALSYDNQEEALSEWYSSFEPSKQKDLAALLIVLCDLYKNEATPMLVSTKWASLSELVCTLPHTGGVIRAINSDSRNAPLEDNLASLVITSPPYINVMNYHQQYRRSVEVLGYKVLAIAKSELGSNRRNRGNRFLTVIEYAIDMALSLIESSRIAKPGSRMIYVVGKESTVLGSTFSNSEIVYRAACEIAGLRYLMRQQRVFKNRYGKMIYEDVLHFENVDRFELISEEKAIADARLIARDVIIAARDLRIESEGDTSEKVLLLNQALGKLEQVGKA